MPQARNDFEVKQMLTPALIATVQYVADKIYEDNQEIVMDVVYSSGSGEGRTWDLLTAWKTEAHGGGGHATGKFEFDPGGMNDHASAVNGESVTPEGMIQIVYQGLAGDFGLNPYQGWNPSGKRYAKNNPLFAGEPWANPRDAWKALVKRIGKRKIRQYIEEGMSEAGLKWRSHGGPIGMITTDARGNSVIK